MASFPAFRVDASGPLNPDMVVSPGNLPHGSDTAPAGHHQTASISSQDELPQLPCRRPVKLYTHTVKILRYGNLLFGLIATILVGNSPPHYDSTTPALLVFLIISILYNILRLVEYLKPPANRFKMPGLSCELGCFKLICGDHDNPDEIEALLQGRDWRTAGDDRSSRVDRGWCIDLFLAVVLLIILPIHMVILGRSRNNGIGRAGFVFSWFVIVIELALAVLQHFPIFRGATVFLCPDEDVEADAQGQVRLPPSPTIAMSSRAGSNVSIVA